MRWQGARAVEREHDHMQPLLLRARTHLLKLEPPTTPLGRRFWTSELESPIRHRLAVTFSLQEGRAARHTSSLSMADMSDHAAAMR